MIRSYFDLWKHITQAQAQKDTQAWTDARQEELDDDEFAAINDMEPEYWCWQCKYSDCDRH